MIRIFGDVHAKFWEFNTKLEHTPNDCQVIQVGDFGFWPNHINEYMIEAMDNSLLNRPVYVIDGNHEYFPILTPLTEVTEIFGNTLYVPRGTTLEIDERSILFLGGGDSPDAPAHGTGVSWFKEEAITYADMMKIDMETPIDFMVTHVPPYETVQAIFGDDCPVAWNYSSKAVQGVWDAFGRPPLYCGHLHMNRKIHNVTILNELSYVDV